MYIYFSPLFSIPSLTNPILGPVSFASMIANIAPTLQSLRSQAGDDLNGVFIHRLRFAVRSAEFHQRKLTGELEDAALDVIEIFQEEIAPSSWWAVILCDALDLLQNSTFSPRL